MPYIKQEQRKLLDPHISNLVEEMKAMDHNPSPGIINYVVTKILNDLKFTPSYTNYNAVIGALECAKTEYYRRKLVPYEDKKIHENGDVYE